MNAPARPPLRLGLLQFSPVSGDPDANLETVRSYFDRLDRPIDLALLPENWPAGYGCRDAAERVAPRSPAILESLGKLARQQNCYLCGSMPWPSPNPKKCWNRAILIDPQGRSAAVYDKIHLFSMMKEDELMLPGNDWTLVETPWGRWGIVICFDIRFPELIRRLAIESMDLLLVTAQWPHPRFDHYRTLLRARAIENQCWVAAANRNGESGKLKFFGASMAVDPWGEVAVEMPEESSGWGFADLDFARINEVRSRLPVFPLRRPDVYTRNKS